MEIVLLLLVALTGSTVHAQPPSQVVKQTVRHIYQNYKSDATAPYFSETGERAITSARTQQALTLNDNLTLPGNIGWLDYDPVCDCRDFGNLVLESATITQTDADHADAVMRLRILQNDEKKTSQTLKMVTEDGHWVTDDIVSNHGSVLQAVNSKNEGMPTAIASLQKEQPEAFVAGLFEHIADHSWPWTWMVSNSCRQAVNAFYKTTFKAANNPDEDMSVERQSVYDNPICLDKESLFSRVSEIRVLGKTTDSARIHVRSTLTNGNDEEQELVLQRHEGKREIADPIRPSSGSLLKQIEAKTAARLKQ